MVKRVQAIRCADCHRLRRHPDKVRLNCACGSLRFVKTFPHPDEEQLALKLYADEVGSFIANNPEVVRQEGI